MGEPHLTLYHYWRSSCSWRVRWGLALKGIPFESRYVNLLKGEQKLPEYLAINPSGYLPSLVIREDGKEHVFGESFALLEWMDERWPNHPFLPQNPEERLWVRQLALTVVSQIQPLQNPLVMEWFVPKTEEREMHLRHWIKRGLKICEENLQRSPWKNKGPYSFGQHVTLADICLVPQVYTAFRYKVDLQDLPLVTEIYHRCMELESCQRASPEKQADFR
jgi:maleylacetoacetate isomerase